MRKRCELRWSVWGEIPGQESGHAIDGMLGDASDDLTQIGFGGEAVELGRADQTVDRRRPFAARVRTGRQIIFSAEATARNARSVALWSISVWPSPT